MNRAIKTSIRKTVSTVRTARKYKEIMASKNMEISEPCGITIVFTGYSIKVGRTGKVFTDFTETGHIVWPKEFDIIRFDETFTYGKNSPENGRHITYLDFTL